MSVKPDQDRNIVLSRRGVLTPVAGAALSLAAPGVIASVASVPARDSELSFYNTHTGEKLTATFC